MGGGGGPISLFLVVAAAINGVGGVDPGYSLVVRGGEAGKCAGSTIPVEWTAPEGHEEGNLVVMYTGNFARSSASVPPGTSGELSFATANVYEQQSVIFRYVASAGASVAAALAESEAVLLLAPADVCGECGGDGRAGKALDRCGECGGDDACLDCAGTPFGPQRMDRCGACGTPAMTCSSGARAGGECERDADCPAGSYALP
ncbi:hypothetical protein T484DRAFT_1836938 [Baffinella frigidus]|nr:hypothetical protein T484DRAFT_1836938 [Cryptophyta sp. CCMP2293]